MWESSGQPSGQASSAPRPAASRGGQGQGRATVRVLQPGLPAPARACREAGRGSEAAKPLRGGRPRSGGLGDARHCCGRIPGAPRPPPPGFVGRGWAGPKPHRVPPGSQPPASWVGSRAEGAALSPGWPRGHPWPADLATSQPPPVEVSLGLWVLWAVAFLNLLTPRGAPVSRKETAEALGVGTALPTSAGGPSSSSHALSRRRGSTRP